MRARTMSCCQAAMCAAACMAVAFASIARGDDWPQWRGPSRDGISQEKGLLQSWPKAGPPELWRVNVGNGYSSIVVSDGRVYTVGNDTPGKPIVKVWCLDATGSTIWSRPLPATNKQTIAVFPGPRATPTVDEKRLYVQTQSGDFACLDKQSGQQLWAKDFKKDFDFAGIDYGSASSALVLGDLVIVEACAPKANVVAYKKATGEQAWTSMAGRGATQVLQRRGSYSSPVAVKLGDKTAVLCFGASGLAALNPSDGKTIWTFDWNSGGDRNIQTPVVDGDRVFICNGDAYAKAKGGAMLKMGAETATLLWQNMDLKNQWSTAIMWKGCLYGFHGHEWDDATEMVCMDAGTGSVKWRHTTKMSGSLLLAEGKLICLSLDGRLSLVDASPAGYRELAACQVFKMQAEQFKPAPGIEAGNVISPDVCRTPPALADGRLYLRNTRGEVVCLDLRAKNSPASRAATRQSTNETNQTNGAN